MAKTIGSILVGVGLDTTKFQKDLKNLQYSLKRTATKFSGWGQDMSLAISAPIVAGAALAVQAFAEEENAIIKMNAAIKANGKNVNTLGLQYKTFAAQMQRLTVVEDDAVIAALQLAESMKLANPQEAVQGAIGLSRAFGIDLNTALKATAKGMSGQFTALQRLIPSIKLMGSDTEKAALFQDILNNSFKLAQEETTSTSGKLTQLKNTLGDLAEEFGGIVADYIKPFIDKIRELIYKFQALSPETKKTIVNFALMAAAVGPVLLIFGKLAGALSGIISFARTIGVSLAGLSIPLAAFLAASGYVIANWSDINKLIKDANANTKDLNEQNEHWKNLNLAIADTYSFLKAAGGTFYDWLSNKIGLITGETQEYLSLWDIGAQYGANFFKRFTNLGAKTDTLKSGQSIPFIDEFKANASKVTNLKDGIFGTGVETAIIESALGQLSNLGTAVKSAAKGSLTWLNDEISKLQKKISENVLTPDGLVAAIKQIVGYENKVKKFEENIKKIRDDLAPRNSTPLERLPSRSVPLVTPLSMPGLNMPAPEVLDTTKNKVINLSQSLSDMANNGLMLAAEGFADMFAAIASGGSVGDVFRGILDGLLGILEQFAKVAIAAGFASEGIKKALQLNPYLAIAGGVALLALTKLVRSQLSGISKQKVPGYASGGIFGDESLIRVGEYPGASTNPEVVAPLDKLKDMLRLNNSGMQLSIAIDSRLQGSDLRQSIKRTESKYSRL